MIQCYDVKNARQDILKMIQYWGQNEPSVDLNGDGIVDEKDLEVLMDYWQQDVNDPTLLSHWALDEVEGTVAYDSAGVNDAFLVGDPVWQSDCGNIDGADTRIFSPTSPFVSTCEKMVYNGKIGTYDADRSAAEA